MFKRSNADDRGHPQMSPGIYTASFLLQTCLLKTVTILVKAGYMDAAVQLQILVGGVCKPLLGSYTAILRKEDGRICGRVLLRLVIFHLSTVLHPPLRIA